MPGTEEPLQQLCGTRYGGGLWPWQGVHRAGRGWPWPLIPCSALPAWPCPENSVCAPDGPGLIQCLCDSPFHGYKCQREVSAYGTEPLSGWALAGAAGAAGSGDAHSGPGQGPFPMLLFGGILGTVTVSLSLLLWGTQRRKAKTP